MSFLPDIIDGKLEDPKKEPTLFTPPQKIRTVDWEADGMRPDRRRVQDAPVMEDMHECIPNEHSECGNCGRIMLI